MEREEADRQEHAAMIGRGGKGEERVMDDLLEFLQARIAECPPGRSGRSG